jgi:hypothetical protein
VKEHRFFRGIDWESVLRKELRPPVVNKIEAPASGVPAEEIFGEMTQGETNKIMGWTFVHQ